MKKRSIFFTVLLLIISLYLGVNYTTLGFSEGNYQLFINLMYVLQLISIFFIVYPTIISILGFRKYKPTKLKSPEKMFAVIVAAHNEETVVGDIVKNLNELNYPKNMYDVYVICDNCTDRTADIVRYNGALAMERFNPAQKGKGYALEWMFDQLWEMEKKGKNYDAVVMFDADNLVNKDFLAIMNTKLLEGHEVIQGYLDSKNPSDSWISKSYAFSYWATNQIFQLSRENLGLSAQIGGTGVVVTTKVLKEIGWGATSLTEDLEFTQRYILQTGNRVAWAHEAKVYDEKPLDLKSSWKQRVRWMQGHADCMMRYSGKLFSAVIKKRKFLYLDTLVYLVSPGKIILTIINGFFLLLALLSMYFMDTVLIDLTMVRPLLDSVFSFWIYLAVFILYHSLPFIGIIREKKAKSILWFPLVLIFSLTWLPITIIGFLKRKQKEWVHTKHTKSVTHP